VVGADPSRPTPEEGMGIAPGSIGYTGTIDWAKTQRPIHLDFERSTQADANIPWEHFHYSGRLRTPIARLR
jgi:hypothetical protein